MAERHFREQTDPGQVVIDEVMGMLITLLLIPVGWKGAAAGFLLFRVMDVIKPFPANKLERLARRRRHHGRRCDGRRSTQISPLRACIWLFGHLVT